MALIDRVKAILQTPKAEWPVIEQEPGDIADIYRNYLILLVAIPALAGFIGFSIVGAGPFRVPFFSGLVSGILHYLLTLVMVYVLALIVDTLAPIFGGTKNALAAFKLIAYGMTASLVAGALTVFPILVPLTIVGSLYSLYLIYLGLPVLMKCPQDKALLYTAAVALCAILASVLLTAITGPALGSRALGDTSAIEIRTPNGELKLDTSKLEAAGKQLSDAAQSGDAAATSKAAGAAVAALTSSANGGREPIPTEVLKAMLPDSVGDLPRVSLNVQSASPMGIKGATAEAQYQNENGTREVSLKIVDMGGLAGLAAIATWANITGEKETSTLIEKTYRSGTRTIKESAKKDGSRADYSLILENGVVIEIEGRGIDLPSLKSAADALGLSKLESYKAKR